MDNPAHVEDVIQQVARTERLAEEILTSKHQVGFIQWQLSTALSPSRPFCTGMRGP